MVWDILPDRLMIKEMRANVHWILCVESLKSKMTINQQMLDETELYIYNQDLLF